MQRARASLVLLSLVAIAASGCDRDVDYSAQLATSVRQIAEGPAIKSVRPPVWADVRTFYEQRQNAPAWMTEKKMSGATRVLETLRSAPAHGFAPEDYDEPRMTERLAALEQLKPDQLKNDAPKRIQEIADLDVRLTTALFAFGRDVAGGRTTPTAIDPRWKIRRELPDLAGALGEAVDGDLKSWIDAVRPPHTEYAALQEALTNLLAEREKLEGGNWPHVPSGTYSLGQSNQSLMALRQRLAAGGHLTNAAASNKSPIFSEQDAAGVRSFQELHGVKATGVVDAATLAALNVSLDDRIQQIAINLERWRWMPNDFGARHLLVNIPYFHLFARENGKRVKDIRVVVGKADEHKTPIFSSVMTTVVFSPYWNIPDSIVEAETAPALARDSSYLEKNNIEILDMSKSGATPVDYDSVNWDDARQLKRLAFRQRPGPKNALGYVKFLFPNDFDVYLHDTPSDALFARQSRALSHGCVRVEEPEALAQYVLRGDPNWNDAKILYAMHAGEEKHVKLRETIPVHIVYFTAWVDDDGALHFQSDVYGYDADQAAHSRPI